jgi:hypothetical protein
MPEWRALVRQRLAGLGLRPIDEIDVVEEMAQHLEDRYADLRQGGAADDAALSQSLEELDGQTLAEELLDSLTRKSGQAK